MVRHDCKFASVWCTLREKPITDNPRRFPNTHTHTHGKRTAVIADTQYVKNITHITFNIHFLPAPNCSRINHWTPLLLPRRAAAQKAPPLQVCAAARQQILGVSSCRSGSGYRRIEVYINRIRTCIKIYLPTTVNRNARKCPRAQSAVVRGPGDVVRGGRERERGRRRVGRTWWILIISLSCADDVYCAIRDDNNDSNNVDMLFVY